MDVLGRQKKRTKIKSLLKLAILALVFMAKIFLLLKIITTKLQVKFLIIAFLNFVITLIKFWWGFKKDPSPQKIIYYEHAQHQHHYDHDNSGGYWSRSGNGQDEEYAQDLAYSRQKPYDVGYEQPNDSWWW